VDIIVGQLISAEAHTISTERPRRLVGSLGAPEAELLKAEPLSQKACSRAVRACMQIVNSHKAKLRERFSPH
jgi:hypothetical protein